MIITWYLWLECCQCCSCGRACLGPILLGYVDGLAINSTVIDADNLVPCVNNSASIEFLAN